MSSLYLIILVMFGFVFVQAIRGRLAEEELCSYLAGGILRFGFARALCAGPDGCITR